MYLDRMLRRLAELAEMGCLESDDQAPGTLEEIATLEGKLGFLLPGVVREFYLWGGNDLGNVFAGMDVVDLQQQRNSDFRADARETLEEAGEDPAMMDGALVVQVDCDAQFSFVRADQGDDPPVYTHTTEQPTFCSCERFSDYLRLMVEQHASVDEIELVGDLEELAQLAERGHRAGSAVRHIQFRGGLNFGVIPGQVFAFTELRSLNLVGKGLLELSPRIAELPFLQRLELARNSLTSLPMALAKLAELSELDLADNQLGTVIAVLRCMPRLRYCWLTGNPIAQDEVNQLIAALPQVQFTFSAAGDADACGDSA